MYIRETSKADNSFMQARQIFFPGQGRVAFETIELPEVGDNQVMVETISSVISPGTELAFLHGLPNTPGQFPMRIAYCSCGRVTKKGSAVEGLKKGQCVANEGLHATVLVLDAEKCTAVPDGVSPEQAACFSLVSIAMQGVRKARINLGDSVAVLGLGLVGNISGQLAKICGALNVTGIDPLEWRQKIAIDCGFDFAAGSVKEALKKTDADEGFDVVIEASGAPIAITQAFEAAKVSGRVILAGSTRGTTEQVDFYNLVHKKGLAVIGAHNFRRPKVDDMFPVKTLKTDHRTALELLARGRIKVLPMISDRIPAEQAPSAYERLWARKEKMVTIALDWTAERRGS